MKNMKITKVHGFALGQTVTWSSAAGQLFGTVSSIDLAKNANQHLIPWINIKSDFRSARLAATPGNFAMMKLRSV